MAIEIEPSPAGQVRRLPDTREPIAVVTLGCPKNLVDSESMLGQLNRAGFSVTGKLEEAALVVVNTCAFLTASQEESIDTILRVARLKETGRLRKLVVAGCLSSRHGRSLLDEIPEVDYLIGPGTVDEVVAVAEGLLAEDLARGARLGGLDRSDFEWEPRVISGSPHAAYLKISEGCNQTCAFCIIPQLRGRHRSRPLEELVAEAEYLVGAGVREITVVAQDTTSYGLDLYGRFSLDRLLEQLDQVEGLRWIRLLYTYPRAWTPELLDCFGRLPRLCPYVDMPIQHAADSVLKRMRRGAKWERTRGLFAALRARVPGIALRTTVITGFPGETEEEFQILLDALAEVQFEHLGAFAYSTEDGTPAGSMDAQLPMALRQERRNRVLEQQRSISRRKNRQRVGKVLEILVDEVDQGAGTLVGRWAGQAIEIDGQVRVTMPRHARRTSGGASNGSSDGAPVGRLGGAAGHAFELASGRTVVPGEFLQVKVCGAGPYDLIAVPLGTDETEGASLELSLEV